MYSLLDCKFTLFQFNKVSTKLGWEKHLSQFHIDLTFVYQCISFSPTFSGLLRLSFSRICALVMRLSDRGLSMSTRPCVNRDSCDIRDPAATRNACVDSPSVTATPSNVIKDFNRPITRSLNVSGWKTIGHLHFSSSVFTGIITFHKLMILKQK